MSADNIAGSAFERDLDQTPANYQPLTPLDFLERSAAVYPDKTAVIDGDRHFTYAQFHRRCHQLASALATHGIGTGDTVAVMAPNVTALLEAHYGVPMTGAVLNAINVRQDAASIAYILEHGGAKILIVDREFSPTVKAALGQMKSPPRVVDIDDPRAVGGGAIGDIDYETFIAGGDADYPVRLPADEWQALSLCYTSGTTGAPKGVVYHHRGAYLNALGNAMMFGLGRDAVYLWTLPMFHCNGWCYTWAVTAVSGTHVCLRKMDPAEVFSLINKHAVTHMCGAPIVLNALIHAPDDVKIPIIRRVEVATGGAAPPSAVIAAMEEAGFRVTHLYGLTESYGPATLCEWQDDWADLPLPERARRMARQGVRYITLGAQMVADPETMEPVSADGETIGEIMLRGNTVMKGYFKSPDATDAAFQGGWFHTGDLAVMHPDGYVEIKDRSKDIIISGGENISSLEVEDILYRHRDIMEAAVVAMPDDKWGETPCAFVTLRPGAQDLDADGVINWCRDNMAHFKCPRYVVFGPLPKTSTGKIQKYLLRQQAKDIST